MSKDQQFYEFIYDHISHEMWKEGGKLDKRVAEVMGTVATAMLDEGEQLSGFVWMAMRRISCQELGWNFQSHVEHELMRYCRMNEQRLMDLFPTQFEEYMQTNGDEECDV
jgi:hypothetical protein